MCNTVRAVEFRERWKGHAPAVGGAAAWLPHEGGPGLWPSEGTPWCLAADSEKAKLFCGKIRDDSDCSPRHNKPILRHD